MKPRKRLKGRPWIPGIWRLLIAYILLHNGRANGYDFKQETSNFVGKGLMGDFGDFDNTGHLNFVTYSYDSNKDNSTIYIYSEIRKGDPEKPYRMFEVHGECDGLTCADLNLDNKLDILLIMKKKREEGENKQLYYLLLYTQAKDQTFISTWDSRADVNRLIDQVGDPGLFKTSKRNIAPREFYRYSTIHPLVGDFDGNGQMEIITQGSDMKLIFWINFLNLRLPFYTRSAPSLDLVGNYEGYIPNPHSSAFIDMNGDCRPDLVFVKESTETKKVYVEIWLADVPSSTLIYKKWDNHLELPKNHGMLTFADFNGSGTFDILVPFCEEVDSEGYCQSQCKLGVSYNKQIPFNAQMFKTGDHDARHPNTLCTPSPMSFSSFTDDKNVVKLSPEYTFLYPLSSFGVTRVTEKFNNLEGLLLEPFTKLPTQLASAVPGDFNNNGFMDIIVTLKTKKGAEKEGVNTKYYVMVVKNTAKERGTVNFNQFIPISISDPNAVLTHVTTADIMDRRSLNLLIFVKIGEKLTCLYYTAYKETLDLFMKIMTKNIVIEESKYPDGYFNSGSNNNGMTYVLTVIDINGIKFPRVACLRPQTAHTPLYTPFAFIGLGKTNNYVEEFYLGLSSSNKNYKNMWISIIPSCTVVTVPIPLQTPTQWSLKLSIIPGKKLFTILLTTSISLLVFGIIILVFDFKEKREDIIQAKGFRQKFIIN